MSKEFFQKFSTNMIKGWLTEHLYRKKVIAIIVDNKNEYLIDQLVNYGSNDWNFSGGGIEINETEEQTLFRELQEELGTNKFKVINKSNVLSIYNWPFKVILRNLFKKKRLYIGQSEKYFIVRFTGKREEITPDPKEIRKIKWIKRSEFKNYLHFPNQVEIAEEVLEEK